MLDIKFLRENPEIVKQNIRNKFQDQKLGLVDEVIELDAQKRAAQQEADNLRAERNKLAKQIGALMGEGKKDEAEAGAVVEQIGQREEQLTDDLELVAVISAAVAASTGASADSFVVRSIRRR